MWLFLRLDTQTAALSAMFALMAVSVSACVTGETHGLNALPKQLNPHGAAIMTTINPIAGALGAAFFVGATNIGEQLSSAPAAGQNARRHPPGHGLRPAAGGGAGVFRCQAASAQGSLKAA